MSHLSFNRSDISLWIPADHRLGWQRKYWCGRVCDGLHEIAWSCEPLALSSDAYPIYPYEHIWTPHTTIRHQCTEGVTCFADVAPTYHNLRTISPLHPACVFHIVSHLRDRVCNPTAHHIHWHYNSASLTAVSTNLWRSSQLRVCFSLKRQEEPWRGQDGFWEWDHEGSDQRRRRHPSSHEGLRQIMQIPQWCRIVQDKQWQQQIAWVRMTYSIYTAP